MRIIIETECDNPYQIYDADLDIYYNYKEVKRVRDHIKVSDDIATLEACKDALTTDELRKLYELKRELLEQPA